VTPLQLPAFFMMPRLVGKPRVHHAWPVLAPHLRVKRTEAGAVTRALLGRVQEAVRHDALLALRLSVAVDGEPDEVQVDVPWRKGQLSIRTPAWAFTAGRVPSRERAGGDAGPQRWVALPRLHAVLPMSAEDPGVLQRAVTGWIRAHEDGLVGEVDADSVDDESGVCGWARQRGDRFGWVDLVADVPEPELGGGPDIFRLLFGGGGQVDGAAELRKVATCLNDLHPDGLLLDAVPDERVARLTTWLFDEREPVPTAIIGPRGSGRTTLLHAAVRRRLAAEDARTSAGHDLPQVHHLDPNRVISGMSRLGQWETRLSAILQHVAVPSGHASKRHALFVDNAVALARIGRSKGSALSLTRLLRPWLADRAFPFVVEATPEEWSRLEELDRGFTDLFLRLRVEPPPFERTLRILLSAAEAISREEGKSIELGGIRAVLAVEARFPSGREAPGGLVDRLRRYARATSEEVDEWEVDSAIGEETGFADAVLNGRNIADAPGWITARLAGQPEMEAAMLDLVATLGAGLARPGRPLATWLLVGPTGVGKTEAAKVLAELLYSAPGRLIRLDMNEYVDNAAASRLLGVAGSDGGTLTSRVRAQPRAVVLLDEIEKAHPSVHDLLLQVLDEGWLGDGDGQRVDFSRAVVLMTSNVGAQDVARATGFGVRDGSTAGATLRAQVWRAAIQSTFRPELVNRISRVVLFRSLDLPTVRAIAERQLARIFARDGFLRRTFLLEIDPAVVDSLAAAGFDPDLGARAMKRVLERDLVQPIATMFSALPVAEPVRVRIFAGAGGISSEVQRWRFAPPILPGPPLPPVSEPTLRALRDAVPDVPLRATIGPRGTELVGAREFALREAVDALLAELPEDATELGGAVDLRPQELERLRGRYETGLGNWRERARGGPIWDQAASARSVREFLLALPLHTATPAQAARALDERAFRLHDRLRALVGGGASEVGSVRLLIRPLVDHARMQWPVFTRYLDGLSGLVHGFGGTVEATTWRGSWHPGRVDEPGVVGAAWEITGLPDARWVAPELGAHVCYPAGGAPSGLLVEQVDAALSRADLADLLRAPRPGAETIVRLRVPLAKPKNATRVTDLRLGETHEVEEGGEGRLLERLWYALYTGRHAEEGER